jgi:hypothetical protein
MPMTVTCASCGKRLTVRDELAGKKLKCPGCGNTFDAKPGGSSVKSAARNPGAKPGSKSTGPRVAVSWGFIAGIGGLVAIVICILLFVFGPVAAWKSWEKLGSKPGDDVHEVVTLALQGYLSEHGMWNPRKPGHEPRAMDDTMFIRDMFVMSMPDVMPFKGSSTEGPFKGKYHTKTGEVEADVDIGGKSIEGLGAVHEGGSKIHVTGRMKGGSVSAEVDGKKAEIHYPPKAEDE